MLNDNLKNVFVNMNYDINSDEANILYQIADMYNHNILKNISINQKIDFDTYQYSVTDNNDNYVYSIYVSLIDNTVEDSNYTYIGNNKVYFSGDDKCVAHTNYLDSWATIKIM